MFVNPELFVIKDENYILYVPLQGKILEISEGAFFALKQSLNGGPDKIDPKVRKKLLDSFIISETPFSEVSFCNFTDYKPTSVTILPTFDCNLRCSYCYAEGGKNVGKNMSFDIAKSAINFILKNAKESGEKRVKLSFHGGGEPFYYKTFQLVKESVKYFQDEVKKTGLESRITSATNGVISPKRLDWILENFDSLNISLDGYQELQNNQRPIRGGW